MLCKIYMMVFFFSSRRRHTRWTGDWSSDVCSSDLIAPNLDGDTIEVWGDGEQTRSFMYIDDCVEGLLRFMESDYDQPLNLGTDRLVTINQLVDIVAGIAAKRLVKRHDLSKPQGVRGRNSDNTRIKKVLGWEPSIPLEEGLEITYKWIESELRKASRISTSRARSAAV